MTQSPAALSGVGILGTGSSVPDRVVTNDEIARTVDTSDEWIQSRLGIRERRVAAEGQCTSALALGAATRALQAAGARANDLDVIIVATATPDRLAPSTACRVQGLLGASRAIAFDVAAVCSGFLYGTWLAYSLVSAGQATRVLVVGADTFSRITNWRSRDCVFFGDGAGAVVIGPCRGGFGFLSFDLGADGRGWESFTVRAGGSETPASNASLDGGQHFFEHDGRAVFNEAVARLPEAIASCIGRCGWTVADVDWIVPHQPSVRILQETARRLGFPFEKVLTNMDRYANTSAATIPLLLDEQVRSGTIQQDHRIVLAAMGAGWTWGAAALRWQS